MLMCMQLLVFGVSKTAMSIRDTNNAAGDDNNDDDDDDKKRKIPVHGSRTVACRRDPLLCVLDDKNRTIAKMKKHIANQKMQLSFYLKRAFDTTKIVQLSETCSAQVSHDNLPLNLALNKFCKQSGARTRLAGIYDRMRYFDERITNSLTDQEFILRKIVNKLCKLAMKDLKVELLSDSGNLSLFNKLLSATIALKNELDGFRITCNRLLIIEDERNAIVDQVYSMPSEHRLNCNYFLGLQMENIQLENEIRTITRQQATRKDRIGELNVIENVLSNLQFQMSSAFSNTSTHCIEEMLKKVNSQARVLVQLTKQQRKKYETEMCKKQPSLKKIVALIRMANDNDHDHHRIDNEDDVELFEAIKREVEEVKRRTYSEFKQEMQQKVDECEQLRANLNKIVYENSKLQFAVHALKDAAKEANNERVEEMLVLKQETDMLRSQVDDLQAIREAYSQLVDRQPQVAKLERAYLQDIDERDKKIYELEVSNKLLTKDVDELKRKLVERQDEIAVLSRFIHLTKPIPLCKTTKVGDNSSLDERKSGLSYWTVGRDITRKACGVETVENCNLRKNSMEGFPMDVKWRKQNDGKLLAAGEDVWAKCSDDRLDEDEANLV